MVSSRQASHTPKAGGWPYPPSLHPPAPGSAAPLKEIIRPACALIPNDENGGPIIDYLKSRGVKPDTFPVTGLDATLPGLQNILKGYQCGTVYKPIYLKAQAAAELAMYIRADVRVPADLLTRTATDPQTKASVAPVLLTPEWTTRANMNSTVIADKFVRVSQPCVGNYVRNYAEAGSGFQRYGQLRYSCHKDDT